MNNREEALSGLATTHWDLVVMGGGASGLGTAVDAAARGFRTLLLERHDFAKGTSSRSTKLIHGGVRYLRQGNVSLVRESLRERGRLLRNAPGIVQPLEFVIPTKSWMESMFYATGMKVYDLLAGNLGIGTTGRLSLEEVRHRVPTLNTARLSGGVSYFDAQFDDAALAVALAKTLCRLGGRALNYLPVVSLLKEGQRIRGVVARDEETGTEYEISARAVVNATGVFSDELRSLDDPSAAPTLALSQGVHLVLDRSFLPGKSAIILPKTDDGRVLFFIPWKGSVLVGTTDVPVMKPSLEPRPLPEEIEFLLHHAERYLTRAPSRADVKSCFAGLRPLVKSNPDAKTSQLSREHLIEVSSSGLVTVSGGKWTTYRQMAEETVETVITATGLDRRAAQTESLKLTESLFATRQTEPLTEGDIQQAVREEMARQVEDVLTRRSRLLMLDARAALAQAPLVAETMARELGRDEQWKQDQLQSFEKTAAGYLLASLSSAPEDARTTDRSA